MATFTIPTAPETPNYVQRTTLDGREFLLRFLHNQREDTWYMSILNTEEAIIKAGIKIVVDWPLIRKFRYDVRMPPGEFFARTAIAGNDDPPGIGELGEDQRVGLVYLDAEGLAVVLL